MLLSLAPMLMQTILPTIFLEFFLAKILLFDADKRTCFCFKEFPTFTSTKKGRQPNLCQLFTYAIKQGNLGKVKQHFIYIIRKSFSQLIIFNLLASPVHDSSWDAYWRQESKYKCHLSSHWHFRFNGIHVHSLCCLYCKS